jgi:NADPH2:quinone reductase
VFANIGVFGANLLALWAAEEGRTVLARAMDGVLAGFLRGELRAVVDRTFPLDEAGAAHAYLQSRTSVGKVVLV